MTIAYWCVLASILMPYGLTLFAKRRMPLRHNKDPRAYKETLSGASQRAVWAEANHYESFPGFAAGVVIAHLAQADQAIVDGLAMGYIGARIVYNWLYLTDRSTLRTLVWFAAFSCIIGFFAAAALTGTSAAG